MRWLLIPLGAVIVVGVLFAYFRLSERFYKQERYGSMVLLTLGLIALYLVAHYFGGVGDDYSYHM